MNQSAYSGSVRGRLFPCDEGMEGQGGAGGWGVGGHGGLVLSEMHEKGWGEGGAEHGVEAGDLSWLIQ